VELAAATFELKRALVELIIDRVIVTDKEVEIHYVVPTSPEGPHYPFCRLRTDYLYGLPRREVARLATAKALHSSRFTRAC
jgi:hypothetical protein